MSRVSVGNLQKAGKELHVLPAASQLDLKILCIHINAKMIAFSRKMIILIIMIAKAFILLGLAFNP